MEQQRDQGLFLPVILLALVAAGVLLQQGAYEGARPATAEPKTESPRDVQSVQARLWQDPFPPVEKLLVPAALEKGDPKAPETWPRLPELWRAIGDQRTQRPLVVLAVMVPGQPYFEAGEQRRRARHAVLSGLNRAGYVPVNEEHLGFFAPVAEPGRMRLPKVVPYEFFEPNRAQEAPPGSSALVLWIDDDAFDVDPLRRLKALFEAVDLPKSPKYKPIAFRVIGPSGSAALATMMSEYAKGNPFKGSPLSGVDFFSPFATADDCLILQEAGVGMEGGDRETAVEHAFGRGEAPLSFLRVSGSDRMQVKALLDELERRCIDPALPKGRDPACAGPKRWQTRIALVAEWDTFYGRALPKTFKWVAAERNEARWPTVQPPGAPTTAMGVCAEPPNYHAFDRILRFSYQRGLDGQAAPGAGKAGDERKDASKSGTGTDFDARAQRIERPEGNRQFDYLRRLADRIEAEDLPRDRIGAIGVLGSDLYDKLLVLQALRQRFPDKVFFTTDMDARLLHPLEQRATRNLIVASSYGLQLNRDLQHDIPPFRDSTQTATLFATLLALDESPFEAKRRHVMEQQAAAARGSGWFPGKVFEVGRTGPFEFPAMRRSSAADGAPASAPDRLAGDSGGRDRWTPVMAKPNDKSCTDPRTNPLQCASIHPPASPMLPAVPPLLMTVGLVLGIAGFLSALALATGPRRTRPLWLGGVLLAAVFAILFLPAGFGASPWTAFGTWLTEGGAGEPVAFVEGISIWPTSAIRVLALLLALGLLMRGAFVLAVQFEKVQARFCLPGLHRPAWMTVPGRELPAAAFGALRDGAKTLRHALAAPSMAGLRRGWRTFRTGMRRTFGRIILRRPTLVAAVNAARRCSGRAPDPAGTGPGVDMGFVWLPYRYQMSFWPRFWRVSVSALLYFVVVGTLFRVWQPNTPTRGVLSFELNFTFTMLSVYTLLFLIFYVLDATRLCRLLVRRLSGLPVRWKGPCLEHYRKRLGCSEEGHEAHLSEWIKMQLIASQTEAVGKLVSYPFIVLALLIIARNPLFDNWILPPSLLIAFSVSGIFAVIAAWNLRSAAEEARRVSVAILTEKLMAARGSGDSAASGQIDTMMNDIKNLRRGAFASYLAQPWLKALMYPLGGLGGGQLLEYLSFLNL